MKLRSLASCKEVFRLRRSERNGGCINPGESAAAEQVQGVPGRAHRWSPAQTNRPWAKVPKKLWKRAPVHILDERERGHMAWGRVAQRARPVSQQRPARGTLIGVRGEWSKRHDGAVSLIHGPYSLLHRAPSTFYLRHDMAWWRDHYR
jgi:hypothetical protein